MVIYFLIIITDVLLRTQQIDSSTYAWKEGFEDWQKIYQIEELKELILDNNSEMKDSINRNKIITMAQKGDNYLENYFLAGDGLWHVYDLKTKTWSKQSQVYMNY